MTLSKTDYILYRECPKNTWYKIHKPELYYESELSEFEKAIIETGNEVELIARQLFPTGILIEGRDKAAQDLTKKYLDEKRPTIFQPVFLVDGFLAALDILKLNDDGTYSIYEVKATNDIDDKAHYHDLTFQYNVMKKLGYKVSSAHLVHLNSEYVRSGELDIIKLFTIEDVTTAVEDLSEYVFNEMDQALQYVTPDKEPNGPCSCIYKGRSRHCSTFKHSNPQVPAYSVHDISRIGISKAKLQEMIDVSIFDLKDVPDHIKLSDTQRNQIDAHVLDRILMHKDKIAEEFEALTFPLYFLDYETFPCAVPRYDGFTPYQQIPFQYSLFVLDSEDAEPRHFEYLCTDPCDPSNMFAESLEKNIGKTGSVVVWNKRFECKINEELGIRLPGHKALMEAVNGRVYDLMDVFGKQYYVHKDFKGKTSIKSILPVLVPELSYKKLGIQEGGTASQSWNELISDTTTDERKEQIAVDLKEYCKLDTYAMYAIWNSLRKIL
jgi:hypothetical protein